MTRNGAASAEQVGRIVRRWLGRGGKVEIDGLGVFRRDAPGSYLFEPRARPRVFIAYVTEDAGAASRLFENLVEAGFDPWLDRRKLFPGQNWPRAIEGAIETCEFFVPCFSKRAVQKKGQFQSELRFALECARRVPVDDIFIVPLRLEPCRVPRRIAREIQYVDLFPDWDAGVQRAIEAMRCRSGAAEPVQ